MGHSNSRMILGNNLDLFNFFNNECSNFIPRLIMRTYICTYIMGQLSIKWANSSDNSWPHTQESRRFLCPQMQNCNWYQSQILDVIAKQMSWPSKYLYTGFLTNTITFHFNNESTFGKKQVTSYNVYSGKWKYTAFFVDKIRFKLSLILSMTFLNFECKKVR